LARSLTRLTPAPLPQADLDERQRLACLRLIRSSNVGPVTFRELINQFGGAVEALEALPELSRRGGRHSLRICARADAEAELEAADRIGARPLFTIEPGYPPALAVLPRSPPLLYAKGDLGQLLRPTLAIVGARNGSAAGQKLARLFAARIGSAGLAIASGLARGIDAAAHEAALATGTVAVVAGGYRCGLPAGARAATGPDRRARLPGQRAATWFRAPRQGLPPPQPHHFRHQRLLASSSRAASVRQPMLADISSSCRAISAM
jgi:hypothetical protein